MLSAMFLTLFLFLISVVLWSSRIPRRIKELLLVGVMLRLCGAAIRYIVIYKFYEGHADAVGYHEMGVWYASFFNQGDFSPLLDSAFWRGGAWWGTEFIRFVTAFIISILGPSLPSEFVIFSLFGFTGLVCFAIAFQRTYSRAASYRYAGWLCLFPSLWFWPSSIGKEAVILLGVGITVLGFVGRRQRINWLLMAVGLFLVFGARPQVAGVLLGSLILAQWLGFKGSWTPGRILQGLFLLVLGVAGIMHSMKSVGIEDFDREGIQSYAMNDPARRTTGGTSVGNVSLSPRGVPMAVVNVLFRPLPWEATNVMVFLSSLEIAGLWVLALHRRKKVISLIKRWREDRLLRLSLAFIALYSIPLGMMLVNAGIIARMRIFVFPFLFLLFEGEEAGVGEERRVRTVPPLASRR